MALFAALGDVYRATLRYDAGADADASVPLLRSLAKQVIDELRKAGLTDVPADNHARLSVVVFGATHRDPDKVLRLPCLKSHWPNDGMFLVDVIFADPDPVVSSSAASAAEKTQTQTPEELSRELLELTLED